MKNTFIALFAALLGLGFSLASFDAEARRLGGGQSFGMSRSGSAMQRPAAPAPSATPKPGAAPQPAGASRWLGPIAGLAAGIGLAALLSHFGLGEGMANMLMILLLVFGAVFLFRMLSRKQQPALRPAGGAHAPMRFEPAAAPGGATTWSPPSMPADFDAEGFLRQAKINFLRLQAANDAGNLEDIREFTTPEVFAEIMMQFDERKRAAQVTDVARLDAELTDLVTEEGRHVASVRFHGEIREDGTSEAFDEVWHLIKPVDGGAGWKIAGIQQFQ
ncbi:MAG: Tim44-like domain-containing protein [Candidatus Nitricoxidivorans perseverans]|uniref:Tim44-like domain-containing protein n=1 Tax=Candidatus Nitricoxidivorans perseverans TaxID=2975601 RepID=A0AA49FJS3_9PROT|nr:MAG: Tim44-like domain-containing protein [Candidatus Nitricoxidivorans perseverans]